jgi:hypothetical protein
MSARYRMVPTIDVVDVLRDKGFLPVRAQQSRSRIPGKADFTKHMVRFRPADLFEGPLAVGDVFPELVLSNAHDGTSAYNLMLGLFRLACSNGLVCQAEDLGSLSIRHSGGEGFEQQVIDVTYEVMDQAPKTLEAVQTFKQLQLSPPQRDAFAAAAHELTQNESIQADQLLQARRQADIGADLWRTNNVVQENLTQGGLRGRSPSGRRYTSRPIKSVGEDLRINKALWTLTQKMAELVGA